MSMSRRREAEYYSKGSASSSSRDHRSRRSRSPASDDSYESYRDRSKDRSSSSNYSHSRDKELDRRNETREKHHEDAKVKRRRHCEASDSSGDEIPSPPPPPRITKVSMTLKTSAPKAVSSFKLGPKPAAPTISKPTGKVASAFNQESDEEEEEMPSEARMRMRNIGRETPTSAGPNSFGKTKQGFCDSKKIFEKNLRAAMEQQSD